MNVWSTQSAGARSPSDSTQGISVRHTTPGFLPLAAMATLPVALTGCNAEQTVCRDRARVNAVQGRCISRTASR